MLKLSMEYQPNPIFSILPRPQKICTLSPFFCSLTSALFSACEEPVECGSERFPFKMECLIRTFNFQVPYFIQPDFFFSVSISLLKASGRKRNNKFKKKTGLIITYQAEEYLLICSSSDV